MPASTTSMRAAWGFPGTVSGGWTTAMAALTGDVPELEGRVGTLGVPSRVQAAVAFYPPTNFLLMDEMALGNCAIATGCATHNAETSPESRLVGATSRRARTRCRRPTR